MSKKKNRKRIAALMQQQQQGQPGQMPMPTMSNGMVIANGISAPNQSAPIPGNSLNGGSGPKPAKRRRLVGKYLIKIKPFDILSEKLKIRILQFHYPG